MPSCPPSWHARPRLCPRPAAIGAAIAMRATTPPPAPTLRLHVPRSPRGAAPAPPATHRDRGSSRPLSARPLARAPGTSRRSWQRDGRPRPPHPPPTPGREGKRGRARRGTKRAGESARAASPGLRACEMRRRCPRGCRWATMRACSVQRARGGVYSG
jgi:hypothetical protein